MTFTARSEGKTLFLRTMKYVRIIWFVITVIISCSAAAQQFNPGDIPADSWEKVQKEKKGTISALWYDIDPFIYRTNNGNGMAGVEYEIMESFITYIRQKYKVDVKLNWVDAKSFDNIYPYIAQTKKNAVFGWSYFSITDERKKEVKFTPPYMPDVNIIVTDPYQPLYATNEDFIKNLPGKTGYTMGATIMEKDMVAIKNTFYKTLEINNEYDDYAVMERISQQKNAFGYVPFSIYVMGLQKGIKVKRQMVLTSRREGFAGIYPKGSDWDVPVNEYFGSNEFKELAGKIIKKYLGSEVSELIFKVSLPDSLRTMQSDNEMLNLEKEIVSQNLVESSLTVQKEKLIRNAIIAAIVLAVGIMFILYSRFVGKQKFARLLSQRNDIIVKQKEEIEMMNKRLEIKVLLAQINPHLVFNSLNAIQYFITLDDKKNALKYLSHFSRHLRQIIENASSLTVTADKEIKMLRQYLELEQIRFENKFDFTMEQPALAEDRLTEIPSMLVYPFVEAALYQHILTKKQGRGYLQIQFQKQDNYFTVLISDNGDGDHAASAFLAKREGAEFDHALNMAYEQIELLNYGRSKKIIVTKEDDKNETGDITGSHTKIEIPVMNEKENVLV